MMRRISKDESVSSLIDRENEMRRERARELRAKRMAKEMPSVDVVTIMQGIEANRQLIIALGAIVEDIARQQRVVM